MNSKLTVPEASELSLTYLQINAYARSTAQSQQLCPSTRPSAEVRTPSIRSRGSREKLMRALDAALRITEDDFEDEDIFRPVTDSHHGRPSGDSQ